MAEGGKTFMGDDGTVVKLSGDHLLSGSEQGGQIQGREEGKKLGNTRKEKRGMYRVGGGVWKIIFEMNRREGAEKISTEGGELRYRRRWGRKSVRRGETEYTSGGTSKEA